MKSIHLNDGTHGLPKNPRFIRDERFAALCDSIRDNPEYMPARPIVVDEAGTILGGNMRYRAAKELKIDPLPAGWVQVVEGWTVEKKRRFIVMDNRGFGEDDMDLLANDWDIEELIAAGFDPTSLDDLIGEEEETDGDAEPQVDKAEELREFWGVETGQLWQLGDHRLLCGDSTNAEAVARCLGGVVPLLMVTDPPYGVEYDANWRNEADRANGKPYGARAVGKVENDDRADWSEAYALFPGDVAYVWHPPGATGLIFGASLQASGFDIRMIIIWAKSHFPIGRGHYHVQHEPCYYAVRKKSGATGHWGGDRKQTTLWQIPKPQKSETGHSTQKPIECMARPIRNHDSEYIYEPFSGSGTTIIACEQLNRKCRAIEISPGYVAVAIQRFLDATGKEPFKVDA